MISVVWEPPEGSSSIITDYTVRVSLNFSYHPDRNRYKDKVLKITNSTNAAVIIGNYIHICTYR